MHGVLRGRLHGIEKNVDLLANDLKQKSKPETVVNDEDDKLNSKRVLQTHEATVIT